MESLKRGALIVIEGVDRSGKSSQAKQLVNSLLQLDIKAEGISFPDRNTDSGKVITEYLSNPQHQLHDHAIHLLFTANRWEKFDMMKKKLLSGNTLIVDRYSYSGVAYSAAKHPDSESFDNNIYASCNVIFLDNNLDWFKCPESGLIKPDRVFLLTLSNETMIERPGFGTERYENIKMQSRVCEVYKELQDKSWKIIDASQTFENVNRILLADIISKITAVQNQKLEYLNFIPYECKQ